jgi:hypothetical protein
MKHCKKCNTGKDLSDFSKNRHRPDGLQRYCKICQRSYNKGHYNKDKPYYLRKAKLRNTKQREEIRNLIKTKKELPCTDCKQSYPYYVMDFDHVTDRKESFWKNN